MNDHQNSQIPLTGQTPPPPPSSADGVASSGEKEKWGTHVMGAPAVPSAHPDNQHAAAFWTAQQQLPHQQQPHQQQPNPYVYSDSTAFGGSARPSSGSSGGNGGSPMESILQKFNSWSKKAEITANNIWHNLKTGPSVSEVAWDKVQLNAKAITGGGFETIYKQTFSTFPYEKLNKTFACYLSTTTGPVAGTLYLSNVHLAFCSDRPLSFTAPSSQITWTYYKVIVPLANISAINPVVMRDNSSERYLQIVTIDGHDFWFMGFVNFEKAARYISESLGGFVASGLPSQHPASN